MIICCSIGLTYGNDDISDALEVVLNSGVYSSSPISIASATGEAGEPNHASNATPLNSIWFKWTPTVSGSATVDTFGSGFDTVLAIYSGTAFSDFLEIASNDDSSESSFFESKTFFFAELGETYWIAVDGYSDRVGSAILNVSFDSPVADNVADAIGLFVEKGESIHLSNFNDGASSEPGEPAHGGNSTPNRSVWYKWTAPEDGDVFLDTIGSEFQTALAVYTGSPFFDFPLVASSNSDDEGEFSRLSFAATEGETYWIAIDSESFGSGAFFLNLEFPERSVFASISVESGGHTYRSVSDGSLKGGDTVVLGYFKNGIPAGSSSYFDEYDPTEDSSFVILKSSTTVSSGGAQVSFIFEGNVPILNDASPPQLVVFFDDLGTGTQGYIGLSSDNWVLAEALTIWLDEAMECLRARDRERCTRLILYDGAGNAGFPFADAPVGAGVPGLTINMTPVEGSAWTLDLAPDPDGIDGKWVESGEKVALLPGDWDIRFRQIDRFELPTFDSVFLDPDDDLELQVDYECQEQYRIWIHDGGLTYRSAYDGRLKEGEIVRVGYYNNEEGAPRAPREFPPDDPDFIQLGTVEVGGIDDHIALEICNTESTSVNRQIYIFLEDSEFNESEFGIFLSNDEWTLQSSEILLSDWSICLREREWHANRCLEFYIYDGYTDLSGFPYAGEFSGDTAPALTVRFLGDAPTKAGWRLAGEVVPASLMYGGVTVDEFWIAPDTPIGVLPGPWEVEFAPVFGYDAPFPIDINLPTQRDEEGNPNVVDVEVEYWDVLEPRIQVSQADSGYCYVWVYVRAGLVDESSYRLRLRSSGDLSQVGEGDDGSSEIAFSESVGVETLVDGSKRFKFLVESPLSALEATFFWLEIESVAD